LSLHENAPASLFVPCFHTFPWLIQYRFSTHPFRSLSEAFVDVSLDEEDVVGQLAYTLPLTLRALANEERTKEEKLMLWTIFVILLILWLLGLVSGYTISGFIHILLVIALVVLIINLIQGRRPVI